MKTRFLTGVALVVAWSFAGTLTLAESAPAPKSAAARAAKCRADCRSENTHGLYKAYSISDPKLKSPESQKMYSLCVKACTDPLPEVYLQKILIDNGLPWFGMSAASCFDCHTKGKPSHSAKPPSRITGETPAANYLKRDR